MPQSICAACAHSSAGCLSAPPCALRRSLTLEVQGWDLLDHLKRHDKADHREAFTLSRNISTSCWPGLRVGFPISRALTVPSARGRCLLPKAPGRSRVSVPSPQWPQSWFFGPWVRFFFQGSKYRGSFKPLCPSPGAPSHVGT